MSRAPLVRALIALGIVAGSLYVAVTTRKGPAPVVASNDLELSATAHRSIDAGGVLPVALGAPGLVLLLLLGSIARRRRHAAAPP